MSGRPDSTGAALRRRAATVAVAVALGSLTACGSSSSSSSADSGGTAGGSSGSSSAVAPQRGVAGTDSGAVKQSSTIEARSVIMTGQVSLRSRDLSRVRADIDRLVARYGGYVDRENTVDDDKGRVTSSTLELRIPSDSFDTVMDAFGEVATVTSTNRQAEDVTTEVIDVDARVRTAEVSLRRLRKFLGKATNVDSVIRLESEISQREADLASLLAQQRYLRNQTSLATITVTMTRTGTVSSDDPLAHAGFLTGLRNGWQAFLDLALIAATVAGALLPFALVLAMVLVPVVLVFRRASRRRRSVTADPGT